MRVASLLVPACGYLVAGCLDFAAEPATVDTVSLSTTSADLTLGDIVQFTVSVTDGSGEAVPEPEVHWSSSDPTVAVISPTGLVSAVGVGAARISAESGSRSAGADIAVTAVFVAVSAGGFHTCGITPAARAACWGATGAGRLGDGTLYSSSTPVLVTGGITFASVRAGFSHTCAAATNGDSYCWGSNASGQLGAGSEDGSPHPEPQQVANTSTLASLALGDSHTCGIIATGSAFCWGGGLFGQLGSDEPSAFCGAAREPCNTAPQAVLGSLEFMNISAGSNHTCGITLLGDAFCWGWNASGQLGDGSMMDRSVPVPVVGGIEFASVSTGLFHSCARTPSGDAYCWGKNLEGELGDGTRDDREAPVQTIGGLTFASLSAGGRHTCGLTADGSGYCWGANSAGQRGDGTQTLATEPRPVGGGIQFASLSVGEVHTCALSLGGVAYCWGSNLSGQLGTGSGGMSMLPVQVAGQP